MNPFTNTHTSTAEINPQDRALVAQIQVEQAEQSALDHIVLTLQKHFSSQENLHCLLLVDPSLQALAECSDADIPFSDKPIVRIAVDHAQFPQDHRPYLMTLDLASGQDLPLLIDSVRMALEDHQPDNIARGHGQRIGGWLSSTANAQQVAQNLSAHVLQADEQARRRALRFYDNRVLSLLWPVLLGPQRRSLLGPLNAWYALDASAELCAYRSDPATPPQWPLSRGQWQAIHRHSIVNLALGQHMQAQQRQPLLPEVAVALAAAARAEQYGLDETDKITFVGHALAWHPQFDDHPAFHRVLQEVAQGCAYTTAIDGLEPAELEQLRSAAWLQDKQGKP